jgi:hypothetical protein
MKRLALAGLCGLAATQDLESIRVEPCELAIRAPHRLSIGGLRKDGLWVDVRDAAFRAEDERVARVDGEWVVPLAPGETVVRVSRGGLSATCRVKVMAPLDGPPDFALDVLPVLTKQGCNSGACHGSAKGQNGFKLSLLGYDADADHLAIARELRSRRVNRSSPGESLLLKKPTMAVKHGGGRALAVESEGFRRVRDWIGAGAPRRTREERLESIQVYPSSRIAPRGSEVRLLVSATYSDGTMRDVSDLARYTTNDEAVVAFLTDKNATVAGPGETAVVVRYGGHVAVARLGSPLGETAAEFPSAHRVDELLASKWRQLRIRPAPICPDSVFLRRAYLDAIGTLPTPDESRAFLADPDRAALVDRLLARPEFDSFWTLKVAEWLLAKDRKFVDWIRKRIDGPIPELAKALVTAAPSSTEAAFFRVSNDPREMMEFTLQTFHGFRIQCAQCHNHPLERFSQKEYYALSTHYARVRHAGNSIELAPRGELADPVTGRTVEPAHAGPDEDRRAPFASWLIGDRRFARAWANRIWAEVFGRGLVHPADDMRASNPPSAPDLLDWLAEEFRKAPRLRPMVRLLMTSRAYGLSSKGTADERTFARAVVRPLGAEVLLDAIAQATGMPNDFGRAIELVGGAVPTLEIFGRCPRAISCSLKAEFTGSLRKALHLIGDRTIEDRLRGVRAWLDKADAQLVDELYLRTVCRPATPEERRHWEAALAGGPRAEIAQDLLWALLVSNEFQFRN